MAGAALVLLVGAELAVVRWEAQRCPEETVYYQDGCIFSGYLSVILGDGQNKADLETAIATYDGWISTDVEELGIFGVSFPIEDPEELDRVRAALAAAGFQVGFSIPGSLFGSRSTPSA